MITLLLACTLALQQQQPPPAADGWYEADGMYLIINEDTVTVRQFGARLAERLSKHQGVDKQAARNDLVRELVVDTVGTQAGETMGIDPALIDRYVHERERGMIQQFGGVDAYTKALAGHGMTAEEMREENRREVLRQEWEESRTGKGMNSQQKVIADRFIRPGYLRLTYTRFSREPRLVGRIGGTPSLVVLQILEVDPAQVGGMAQAESMAAKIRARIATGVSSFDAESGFRVPGSKIDEREPLDESKLVDVDPALAKLVAAAKEGDVLPPVPPIEKTSQWRVVKLVRRTPAVLPGFSAPGLQVKIREFLEGMLDDLRLAEARSQQFAGSYIWPPEAAAH